jgi:uncharacterized protein (TIGR02594 family)
MTIQTPYDLATRYIGIHELGTDADHPLIQWWLSLCGFPSSVKDEVAWCSAFVNGMCWEFRLPRSKSAAARSWLRVGTAIPLVEARPGVDIVVLSRGTGPQPGPSVIDAPGHVGFFAGEGHLLAGNQGDAVSVAPFDPTHVLGVRRLE